jgi:CDP-diacylglycerol--glycerol-3-phosphate 3-phosphatidyltransferase
MASIYDLKPRFQALLRPMVIKLASNGVTANAVTLLAMFISFFVGAAIYLFPAQLSILLLVPFVMLLRMVLNAVDGMLAREHNMKSPLGAILNELTDVLSDAALYLPFSIVVGINPVWVVLIVVMAIVSEMAGVVAVQIGAERRYEGPMGKSDRAFIFGLVALLLGLQVISAYWVNYIFVGVFILLCYTVFNRSRAALTQISSINKSGNPD